MNPLISIIIPVYNRHNELFLSLESVKRQTYSPIEVIIVDDGSSPSLKNQESKIKEILSGIPFVLLEQENKGAPAARNKGFEFSKGKFVIFWDADTLGKSDMLQKMAQELQDSPQYSYVYSMFLIGWKKMKSHPFDADLLKQYNYIDTTSLLRREDFVGFDESLKRSQDWDLWLTLLKQNKKGSFINKTLFKKIVNSQHAMSAWIPKFFYRFPWKGMKAKKYLESRDIIAQKHDLPKF